MKKFAGLFVCALLALTAVTPVATGVMAAKESDRANTLKIYNWEDYIDESILTKDVTEAEATTLKRPTESFQTYYRRISGNNNFKVEYETFDTNETMLTKIVTAKEDYDVVCPSEYAIQRLYNLDLLQAINTSSMTNYKNVSPYITQQFSKLTSYSAVYAVGYFWGTLGILYNEDHINQQNIENIDWSILWNEAFSGKILMKDSIRDSIVAAAVYANKDVFSAITDKDEYAAKLFEIINPSTQEEFDLIEEVLVSQKSKYDVMYEVDDGKGDMTQGTFSLNLAWSGDAWWAIREAAQNVNLNYVIPQEGSNVWFDGWCIPKYAKNQTAAEAFIDYMCRSDVAIANMEEACYTSVIATNDTLQYAKSIAAENPKYTATVDASYFFDEDSANYPAPDDLTAIVLNTTSFPDADTIARCAIMNDFKNQEMAMDMWNAVKGNKLPVWAIVLICIGVVAVIGAIIVFVLLNKKKKERRKKASAQRRNKV